MNLEHEYYELTGQYEPFEGICLVDTFQLVEEGQQLSFGLFTEENSEANDALPAERVKRQKEAQVFVVIGNPPYNAGQVNENDNNKNRKYPVVDGRVRETYAKDSRATNKNALSDPYVKAFRWASDRIGEEGVIAFVTNNSFIEALAFDGMRKHLAQDFDKLYILDLGGNARKGLLVSDSNVFGIRVGVSINLLLKTRKNNGVGQICETRLDDQWRKKQKLDFLSEQQLNHIEWQELTPNTLAQRSREKHTWLTEGLHDEFETFLPMGTKAGKAGREQEVIFRVFSRGAETARDAWAYNYSDSLLRENIERFIKIYNAEVDRWQNRRDKKVKLDDFVLSDDTKIKWSSRLKSCLRRGQKAEFLSPKIRNSLYRPFTLQYLFFDEYLTHRQGQFPRIFPTPATETENRVICVTNHSQIPFVVQITNCIPSLDVGGRAGQCFPFYTYAKDSTNRQENITDWALSQFRAHVNDASISKWDICNVVYALLHHPTYRETYAQNLKRELPRLPYAPDFHAFAQAGEQLAELHLHYEAQEQYELEEIETSDVPMTYRVEKMRLGKSKKSLRYNDFLTLRGIPPAVYEYKLGNRSALHWIINQYRMKTDKRSGITNDPNRPDDPEYIIRLIGQVITVSVETVRIVKGLPGLSR